MGNLSRIMMESKRFKVAFMKKTLIIILSILFIMDLQLVQAHPFNNIVEQQLGTDHMSVSIRDVDTGYLLYMKNGDTLMKPASTLKLLTAASALHVLGENYRWITEVYIDGQVKNNELKGNLYVKGSGDPTFQKKHFYEIADLLKILGIFSISGDIYGDDSRFYGSQLPPGAKKEDESYYYAARISALTMSPDMDFDAGTIIVHVKPSSVGKEPIIETEPNKSGMELINQAKTVSSNEKNTIEINRVHDTNQVIITGNIPMDETFKDWVTLNDPTINTLHALKMALEEEGISFHHPVIDRKEVPKDAILFYVKHSLPLKSIILPFLKLSNNSIADILVKTMGYEVYQNGTMEDGLKVIEDFGEELGLQMEQWLLEDGSGLSHHNRTTANELTQLLVNVKNEPYFHSFYNGLPIGGVKERNIGGSLRNRYNESHLQYRVIAKTGHISGVYTLAGYVKGNSGLWYAFAVMTQNQSVVKTKAIDRVVEGIIEHF